MTGNSTFFSPEKARNMEEIRQGIDILDRQIVELIAQRAGYVRAAAKFKDNEAAVRDEKRVERVIESKKKLAVDMDVSPELIENIYRQMIDFFINEEMKEWNKN